MKAECCKACGHPLPSVKVYTKFVPFVPEHWQRLLVLGMTQTGKSTLVKGWCGYLMGEGVCVIAIDPKDEYSQRGRRGRKHCTLGPLLDRVTVEGLRELRRANPKYLRKKDLALSIVLAPGLAPEARRAELREVLDFIRWRGKCVVIFDECHIYGKLVEHELVETAAVLASEEVVPIYVAQMATMVPSGVRGQCSDCISFNQYKETDRRFLGMDFGTDFAASLEALPPGHFCISSPRTQAVTSRGAAA